MPELPEVESFRKIADRVLVGGWIEKVWAAQDRIVISGVAPRTLVGKLKGRRVLGTDRRGKYAWLVLDRPPHPVFHFGMTGRFEELQENAPRNRYVKLDLTTAAGRLVYDNRRRLGRIRLVDNPGGRTSDKQSWLRPVTRADLLTSVGGSSRGTARSDQGFAAQPVVCSRRGQLDR